MEIFELTNSTTTHIKFIVALIQRLSLMDELSKAARNCGHFLTTFVYKIRLKKAKIKV